jgi:hypothetical protein
MKEQKVEKPPLNLALANGAGGLVKTKKMIFVFLFVH